MMDYCVQDESRRLFDKEILENPRMKDLPPEIKEFSRMVNFLGNPEPSIPINWRFAESISAIKAFEATMLNVLLSRKYSSKPVEININTDHASLFFMSPLLAQTVTHKGEEVNESPQMPGSSSMFPSSDLHRSTSSLHRMLVTNIYKTRDGRFYHCHGSMNPEPSITALKLPLDGVEGETYDDVVAKYQEAVSRIDSQQLDLMMNDEYRQAGTVCWTSEEFQSSEHGKANENAGLYVIHRKSNEKHKPSWWPDSTETSVARPLAGLKVVDLTRVIAGPSITRGLAEMGASVMRVTSPNITDLSAVHQDLNWGKWNCYLDLRRIEDKKKLEDLIKEADVVVDGYRPGVMEKLGFGQDAILNMVKDRERGIILVKENCYGWQGPWRSRSGWQQISDACCGVSMEYGRAMGNDEAVTPVFPNSDYCTGVAGSSGVIQSLINRAETGGSYVVEVSLNYYSQWLVRSCGTYPASVWSKVYAANGSPVFRHYHAMTYLLPAMMKLLYQNRASVLFKPNFFELRSSKAVDATFRQVKPVAQFPNGEVELRYNVGTRSNGVDQPFWPDDLGVEIVG